MADADEPSRRERVAEGWLDLSPYADGTWLLSWTPDDGHPDYPGRSFYPNDPLLPPDFPKPDDPEALLAWGRERYGRRRMGPE
jgi:hypothetical protein